MWSHKNASRLFRVFVGGVTYRRRQCLCLWGGGAVQGRRVLGGRRGVWVAVVCPRAAARVCWPIWEMAPPGDCVPGTSAHPVRPNSHPMNHYLLSPREGLHVFLPIPAHRGARGFCLFAECRKKQFFPRHWFGNELAPRNIMEIELKLFILRVVYVCAFFSAVVLRMRT